MNVNKALIVDPEEKLAVIKNKKDEVMPRIPVNTHEEVVPVRNFSLNPRNTIAKKHSDASRKQCAIDSEPNN